MLQFLQFVGRIDTDGLLEYGNSISAGTNLLLVAVNGDTHKVRVTSAPMAAVFFNFDQNQFNIAEADLLTTSIVSCTCISLKRNRFAVQSGRSRTVRHLQSDSGLRVFPWRSNFLLRCGKNALA